jgi:hypothetical protein
MMPMLIYFIFFLKKKSANKERGAYDPNDNNNKEWHDLITIVNKNSTNVIIDIKLSDIHYNDGFLFFHYFGRPSSKCMVHKLTFDKE